MRQRYVPFHQHQMAEQLLGRLIRSCGLSDDRQSMANRLAGFGDFGSAEVVKTLESIMPLSDVPAFRENFSILFDRLPTVSVFDAILQDAVPAPIRGQIISGEPIALFEIGEAQPIPLAISNFSDEGELPLVKVGGLLGYTQEFLRNLAPEIDDALNRAFLNAIAAASDRALFNRLAANAGPAIPATSSLAADIQSAGELILGSAAGRLHMVISPATAMQFAFATSTDGTFIFPNFDANIGGAIGGVQTHVSDQLGDDSSGGRALLFDASRIAANRGSINIERSENASVQMRSDPENGPTQVVSSFQTNSVFLRVLRTFGLKLPDEQIAVEFTGVDAWFD
jgi:hypothetical protein